MKSDFQPTYDCSIKKYSDMLRINKMQNFKIVMNSTADLPLSYIKENDLGLLYLQCIIDGKTYGEDNAEELDLKDFYQMMRDGKMPTTSQINPAQAKNMFEKCLV